jgi:hypothetical protein
MKLNKKIMKIIRSDLEKHDKLASILQLIIEDLNINKDSYFIMGSYALREYRTINDLDVNIDSKEFKKFKTAKYGQIEQHYETKRWFLDLTKEYQEEVDSNAEDFSIEVIKKKNNEGFPSKEFSMKKLKKNNSLDKDKYGHQHFSLETLLKWKKITNRPKDKRDIELINDIFNKKRQKGGDLKTENDMYLHKYIKYKLKYQHLKTQMRGGARGPYEFMHIDLTHEECDLNQDLIIENEEKYSH